MGEMLAYNYHMAEASSVASSLWETYFSFLSGAVRCVALRYVANLKWHCWCWTVEGGRQGRGVREDKTLLCRVIHRTSRLSYTASSSPGQPHEHVSAISGTGNHSPSHPPIPVYSAPMTGYTATTAAAAVVAAL
jgi:hypothetical protein